MMSSDLLGLVREIIEEQFGVRLSRVTYFFVVLRCRTSGSNRRCPCRSIASTKQLGRS